MCVYVFQFSVYPFVVVCLHNMFVCACVEHFFFSNIIVQVIDPSIPPEGICVQGEKIKAPSDEVLELQAKNPTATFLVRFFDGRRTW